MSTKEIESLAKQGKLTDSIKSVDSVFGNLDSIYLNEKQTKSVLNGIRMSYNGRAEGECLRVYGFDGEFLCISQICEGKLKMLKSFW